MIRIYRLLYRVPPRYQHASAIFNDGALAQLFDDGGQRIDRSLWDDCMSELEAFDANEARQRLEYRLLAAGYWRHGMPGHAIYELFDVVPVREIAEERGL